MTQFVYLCSQEKYIWRNNDWVANQQNTAWTTSVFADYQTAKRTIQHDYEYSFGNVDTKTNRKFLKPYDVEQLKQEAVVGRVEVYWSYFGEKYKMVYCLTKKFLI